MKVDAPEIHLVIRFVYTSTWDDLQSLAAFLLWLRALECLRLSCACACMQVAARLHGLDILSVAFKRTFCVAAVGRLECLAV